MTDFNNIKSINYKLIIKNELKFLFVRIQIVNFNRRRL